VDNTFVGARLRRLREDRGLSQAALARELDLSPSYLNQLEHDARPMTVRVLLRLTSAFGVDAGYFTPPNQARLTSELRETLGDRVTAGEVSTGDLTELAGRLPDVAELLLDLHRRYRAAAEQVAVLAGDRGEDGALDPNAPHEYVREYFYRRHNYVDEIDREAEALATRMGLRRRSARSSSRRSSRTSRPAPRSTSSSRKATSAAPSRARWRASAWRATSPARWCCRTAASWPRPRACATTSTCSRSASASASRRCATGSRRCSARRARRAVLLRARRPRRQHLQAPVRHRLPLLALGRHLPAVERLRGLRAARTRC
jgi:transcriptional regulator with XRE-family HTH domain